MHINWKRKEIIITIALYGPAGSGKSLTWRYWSGNAASPPADGEDTFSLRLKQIQGKQLILNLRDIPGAAEAASRRKVSLYGVDGLVFVVDSSPERKEANRASLQELQVNLAAMNKSIYNMPILLQHNKRDLPDALPIETLHSFLNPQWRWPYQETCALRGEGLVEVLQQATDLVLMTVL